MKTLKNTHKNKCIIGFNAFVVTIAAFMAIAFIQALELNVMQAEADLICAEIGALSKKQEHLSELCLKDEIIPPL